ncbi:MAG: hypothetical protein ABL925_17680 [Methylococcales bacterium]
MSLTIEASAKEEWAGLFGNNGRCNICHSGTVGTDNNVKSAANNAYRSGGLNPGLKNFVASALGTPTIPVATNDKPVLNAINSQWDVAVGEEISIPLIVNDNDDDAFKIITVNKPAGATVADAGIDSGTQLPKWDLTWTPTDAQKNKIYTVKFSAKETETTKKYASNTITTKIRVWPAGSKDQAAVSSLVLATASWKTDYLTLKGKVVVNKIMTPAEKATFLARHDLTVDLFQGKTSNGALIADQQPISILANGSWTLTQPLAGIFSCDVTLSFEGRKASRKISKAPNTCLK